MKKIIYILMAFVSTLTISCEKDSEGLSKTTVFAKFTMTGDRYISLVKGEEYTEPGVTAKEGETDLEVKISGEVNTEEVGMYDIVYSAVNKDGFEGTITRTVAILPEEPITADDILGTYSYVASPATKAEVTKLALGFYRVSNLWSAGTTIPAYLITADGKDIILPLQSTGFGRLQGSGTLTNDGKLTFVVSLLDQNGLIDVPRKWMRAN